MLMTFDKFPAILPAAAWSAVHADAPATPSTAVNAPTFDVRDLSVFYGANEAVKSVSLQITAPAVTAIIGPSGCGKSTFLRALNRMHELTPGARHSGTILFKGEDLYARQV